MFPRARKNAVAIIAVAAAAFCLLFFVPERSNFRSSALFVRDPYSKESKVEVTARVGRNLVNKGDLVILDVNIQNNNPEPLTDFNASILAPGFKWTQEEAAKALPATVPENSSISVAIPLTALARSGSYNISIFYSWNRKSRYSSALSLGPLKMAGLISEEHWIRFLARGAQLIKDLTLPIVLVLLGYYFQSKQSTRDAARQKEVRQEEERQQVRQNILPLVMSLAERHYMPIVRSARLLLVDHKNLTENAPGSSLDKVFFDTLFLLKRMDYLRRDKGQIFFQDSAAEAIAGNAWFVLREKLLSVLGDTQVGLALQRIGNDDGFAEFAAKRYQLQFETGFANFKSWVESKPTDFTQYLKLVDLTQAVFRLEANRPFAEHWYNVEKELSFETDFLQNPDFPTASVTGSSKARIKALSEAWPLYLATLTSR